MSLRVVLRGAREPNNNSSGDSSSCFADTRQAGSTVVTLRDEPLSRQPLPQPIQARKAYLYPALNPFANPSLIPLIPLATSSPVHPDKSITTHKKIRTFFMVSLRKKNRHLFFILEVTAFKKLSSLDNESQLNNLLFIVIFFVHVPHNRCQLRLEV